MVWGYDKEQILVAHAERYIREGKMMLKDQHLILTREGKLLADGIAAALFFEEK